VQENYGKPWSESCNAVLSEF